MIPKIIHYCWFGKNPLPESAVKCIESWKRYCPDYQIIRWDEENSNLQFNDYVKEAYECKKWAFVSDVIRLKIIYEYGGIYFDTDVEVVKNFDELLKYKSFWGFEGKKYINSGLGFGSEKGNYIVKSMLNDYSGKHFIQDNGGYDLLPCPHRNTEILKSIGLKTNGKTQVLDNNIFLAQEYLCPLDYKRHRINITTNTYSIHHYDSSWFSEEEKMSHKIFADYVNRYGYLIGRIIYCLKYLGIKKILLIILNKTKNS